MSVTEEAVQGRIDLQGRLDERGDERRAVPATGVHARLRWKVTTGAHERQVWAEDEFGQDMDGYAAIERREWREDPLMRMAMRSLAWEKGLAKVPVEGGEVELDDGERRVLNPDAAPIELLRAQTAEAAAMRTATCLHIQHGFQDVWATDGSKKDGTGPGGRVERRVACGAFEGAKPVEERHREGMDAEGRRSMGSGLTGARLPASCEVLDAELGGVLLALRASARREAPGTRAVLIMSDSLEALRLMEKAWRAGVRWTGQGSGRAAMLHAINEERGKLRRVITMWVPAHAGVAANAAADAAAKMHLSGSKEWNLAEILRESLPEGRVLQTVDGAPWMMERFGAMKEATGWWVKEKAAGRRTAGATAVDAQRLGPKWRDRNVTRCGTVWEKTGARTAPPKREATAEGAATGEEESSRSRDLLEIAEANAAEGTGQRRKKEKAPRATLAQIRDDAERCGVAMAARDGKVWEAGTGAGKQGCPGCCSHARGWRWAEAEDGKGEWSAMVSGAGKVVADLWHVLCGECEGVERETRDTERNEIRLSMQAAMKELTKKMYEGKGRARKQVAHYMTEGRQEMVRDIAAAQRGLARKGGATAGERESLRRWLAGELAHVESADCKKLKRATHLLAGNVRRAQDAAARLRGAWAEAGKTEMARRSEREGYAVGKEKKRGAMARWAQGVQAMETHASTGEEGEPRGFWTMAAELIRFKMRQKAEAEAAREAKRHGNREGSAHPGDGGVVVIGTETTGTGDGARMTVMCVLRMHTASTEKEVREGAETGTFWHEAVRWAPNGQKVRRIEEALEWMDDARAIRAYTRREEDAHAMEAAYAGDAERLRAHRAKTVDVGVEAFRAGRASTQAEVLRASGHEIHEKAEGAAERQWLDGRLAEMEWWCKARTRALGRVLLEGNAQIPGGHSIHGTTVRREVVRGDSRRRQGEAHTPHDQTQEAARRTASHGKRGRDADAHDDGRAETHGGGRRHRTDGGSGQHTASDPPAGRHGMAQGADAASTHLGEGSRGERRAAAREEEDGGDDDEPGGATGRAGDAAAEEREEAEDDVQTCRCAPRTATAEQGPTTSQTDFHGGNRLRVGRVAAASTLPTLGNGSSSLEGRTSVTGEEFPLPHRSREIDARNIQPGKRERTQPPEHDYGEVQRRKARGGWTPTYFTQARKRQKRDDIQTGAATLARVTGGGYGHRDSGHARRKRTRLFDDGDSRRAGKAGRNQ